MKRKQQAECTERCRHDVIADSLPSDKAGRLAAAMDALKEGHAAILARDDDALIQARHKYAAVVWVMNGRTFFACNTPEGAGKRIAEHCRAPDGEVPMWFQNGRFLVEVEGIRCVFTINEGIGGLFSAHYELHAVDYDRPFVSNTGYRSVFEDRHHGLTVDAAARAVLEKQIIEQGAVRITPDAWCRQEDPAELWPWMTSLVSAAPTPYADRAGQFAFGF